MDSACAEAIVSATYRGRSPSTTASHPGTTHGVSTGLEACAKGCPISEKADPSSKELAREGLSWLSMSSGNQVLLGQYGATNRTCSSSSLILHSVCASRLTAGNAYLCRVRQCIFGENTYLRRPRGQLCASASVPSIASGRE